MVDQVSEGQVAVMPLFVAIAPNMVIEFEGEVGGESGSRAPSRYDVLREQAQATPAGPD
ncbi:MAG: hypothetical protein JSS20_20595 [Proteobacteria bacterium]|nr:hypothetical protein [Pseudomonadota bacterium]